VSNLDAHPARQRVRAAAAGAARGASAGLAAVLLAACSAGTTGAGIAATQTRHLPAFSAVDLAGSTAVTVRVGGQQSVVVRADRNLLSRVTTRVRNGILVIGTTGSFTTSVPMTVQVAMPSLTALSLSGSGQISAVNLNAGRLSVTLSGSGVVRASGSADRVVISLSGSGDARLGQLIAREVRAELSGSGQIIVQATDTLRASVPGSGTVGYSGSPAHVTKNITGSGSIVHR
jgi:hypothetical protein